MPAEPTPEQRLALLLRGVQRMADALGGVDERLQDLTGRVDENRVRSRAELAQVGERVDRLQSDIARSLEVVTALGHAVDAALKAPPPAVAASATNDLAVEHLTDAVRSLRDDLATAWGQLREQTADAVDRAAGDQAERTLRLVESVTETRQQLLDAVAALPAGGEAPSQVPEELAQLRETLDGRHVVVTEALARLQQQTSKSVDALRSELTERLDSLPAPASGGGDDTALRNALAEVRDEVRRLQGDVEANAGQLRTDIGARQARLRDEVLAALQERLASLELPAPTLDPVLDRLAGLEARLADTTSLEPVLERLASLEARLAEPVPVALDPVVERLAALEARIRPVDLAPIAERLSLLDARLAEQGEAAAPAVDLGPLVERLAAVEERLGEAPSVDLAPIAERLSLLDARLAEQAQPAQGVDLGPLVERLEAIDARLAQAPAPADVDLGPLAERLALIDARLHEQAEHAAAPAPGVDLAPMAERLAAIEWRLGEVLDPLRDRLAGVEWRLGEALDPIRERLSQDPDRPDDLLGRLAVIEGSLASLRRDLSVELESVAADTRRGVDRIVGEVRNVDERVGGMADDLRVVRQVRDGLQDLIDGVDATRQLAARAATSQQMAEVTRELGSVLAEIETARSHVLRVERSPQPSQQVVDVEVDQLGRRIEQLAEVIEERMVADPPASKQDSEVAAQVVDRLRNLGSGARQLGNGMLEDIRARRRR